MGDWLVELIDAAGGDVDEGAWYLLYGLAAIAPEPLGDHAAEWIIRLRPGHGADPSWLAVTPSAVPTGEVYCLRDGYSTRFAVLIGCRRDLPGRTDEHVFALDVDTCTSVVHVVDAGVYDDIETAVHAWRESVGVPAACAVAEPVEHPCGDGR